MTGKGFGADSAAARSNSASSSSSSSSVFFFFRCRNGPVYGPVANPDPPVPVTGILIGTSRLVDNTPARPDACTPTKLTEIPVGTETVTSPACAVAATPVSETFENPVTVGALATAVAATPVIFALAAAEVASVPI